MWNRAELTCEKLQGSESQTRDLLCFEALLGSERLSKPAGNTFFYKKLGLSSSMDGISPALGKGLGKSLKAFFAALIELDGQRQRELISEAVRSIRKASDRPLPFEWVVKLNRAFPDEVMVLSPLLLNLIHLKPGEAVMINPGTLHAYLGGAGVELMANSDNVIRAGLTPKTKDVAELLQIVNFHEEDAKILGAEKRGGAEWAYPCEALIFME